MSRVKTAHNASALRLALFVALNCWWPSLLAAQAVAAPNVASIQVSAPSLTTYTGHSVQLTAIARYSDGTTSDITKLANWTSTSSPIAAVNGLGTVAATSAGSATISASFQGVNGTITLTVVGRQLQSLLLSPASPPPIPKGVSKQFKAAGTYNDGTTDDVTTSVTWSSSITATATIEKSTGLLTAVQAGGTNITATAPGGSPLASMAVQVSAATPTELSITPANPIVQIGNSTPLTATAVFSDGNPYTVAVNWSSDQTSVASVSSTGIVTGVATGSAKIKAAIRDVSTTVTVTVVTNAVSSTGLKLGIGDSITVEVYVRGFHDLDNPESPEYFASPGTVLRIDNADKAQNNFYVHEIGCTQSRPSAPPSPARSIPKSMSGLAKIECGSQYTVPQDSFSSHAIQSAGIEYGLLVVPYKFHFQDHSLASGGTIGAYAGVHTSSIAGEAISTVVSAGIGNVTVPSKSSTGTSSTTTNQASLTVAIGEVVTLTKTGTFQLGLLIGWDFAGKSANYQYEGKPWLALSFGANLTK